MKTLLVLMLMVPALSTAATASPEVARLKAEIVALASTYTGQGDPDFSKQESLDVLVDKLVALAPAQPIAQRLDVLAGTWKQVWGPYDYRNNDRGVDPELGVNEIYQVVFKDGYYYNVSPLYKNGDRSKERIGLLRGEFKLDGNDDQALNVKFTRYPGVEHRPSKGGIWELAAKAEAGTLENEITIVPTWIVRLFFSGGQLQEVYTDEDLRICYGTSGKMSRSLYVMTRVR